MSVPASLHPERPRTAREPLRPEHRASDLPGPLTARKLEPSSGFPGRGPGSPPRRRRNPSRCLRLTLGFSLLVLLCGCLLGEHGAEQVLSHPRATPLPAWDQAFRTADPRWQGADSVSTVPLSPGKNLWLFGDTWVDPQGLPGRKQAVIIRNSVALQEISGGRPGRIRFYWKEGPAGPEELFRAEAGPAWLWPLSGVRVAGALCLFFIRLIPSDNALGFELHGNVLIRIPNPDDPPGQWRQERHEIPFFRHGPNGDRFFGVACLAQPGTLYAYGVREDWSRGPEGRSLLLARAPPAAFDPMDFAAWEFFGADGWSQGLEETTILFEGAATEMSVSFLPGVNRFVAVYTHCGLSPAVLARLAAAPQGPWGPPTTLWECPEASWGRDYFCYAGKAHPELALSGNELVITYAANSYKLDDHLNDPRIYWPRFLRVDFSSAGPHHGPREEEKPG